MKHSYYVFWVLTLLLYSCRSTVEKEPETAPNIIYILADDLGYGELGSYGQELIETPHLDQLAATGMRFTQHYSGAPVCAPARCVLLTGKHAGHAHIRGNDEWKERGDVWNFKAMFEDPNLEGQRPIPAEEITIAEILKEQGYRTGCVGKWGLGAPNTEGVPNKQGFDFFYGYNCQRQAHTFYPLHLWKNEERVLLDNPLVPPRTGLDEGADPNDSTSYARYTLTDYSAELMQEEVLDFLERNHERPFFLYYASPIPHVPLQAPLRWINYYRKKLGPEEPYVKGSYFPTQYPRATYAAMISYLDEQVGELIESLRELKVYENTLIIFSSDNGPTYTGGADTKYFNSAHPFKEDEGWGKGSTHEGGVRVPMIASWPGKIAAGSSSDHISIFYDVMPTLCEVINARVPDDRDGISFLPALLGNQDEQKQHEYLYWEFPAYHGQQAVRMGKWKGMRQNIFNGNMDIALFDLDEDPQELHDVAEDHQDIVQEIEKIIEDAHEPAVLERFKIAQLGD
ncbi:MAG: arylsulfatase [Saprospiraceae bacterium]|nr:arylsulfatase [Saprospiraceae bacterium]